MVRLHTKKNYDVSEMLTLLTKIHIFFFYMYNSASYRLLSFWTPSGQGERSIRAKGLQESAKCWWIERLELLGIELLDGKWLCIVLW